MLPWLSVPGIGDLPSVYRVTDLASASIGVAGLATAELLRDSGLHLPDSGTADAAARDAAAVVTVDRGLASAWYGSAIRSLGWAMPQVWDPLARNYRADDGWIRLHTNAPNHRAAALSVLGVAADYSAVHRAVSTWSASALESAIVEAGGCAAVMRSRTDWAAHPQGAAVAAEPLLEWRVEGPGDESRSWAPSPSRPLRGLRVLDLTRVIAGPVASRFLARLGADVLRIDPPDWEEDALVANMTLGKHTARLDAKTREGHLRLRELLGSADVLVHGYRHGALEELGFGADIRRELRPDLIDVSLNAYGFTGPWSQRRGFDSLVQMSSGIAERGMHWASSSEPTPLPVQALDHSAGYLLAAAAIRGITMRRSDGLGRSVRTSLARVAEVLASGGELALDGPILDRAEPTEPLETPWGDALLLRPSLDVTGVPLEFDRGPSALGSGYPVWH